jgi:CHAT domain-containing protein
VFGLQRAFHQAGTKNVVARLRKVNDEPTAALMRLFYRNLCKQNLPPLEALRQAQLSLCRHPAQVTALAIATRGPDFNKVVKLVEGGVVEPTAPRSSPRRWAAFVLSGTGQ